VFTGQRRAVLTYVLPLRDSKPRPDLTAYLRSLAERADVVVVDGSEPAVFDVHHEWWRAVRHIAVSPDLVTPMGKVGGVLTGLHAARCDKVVIADDDVRYTQEQLERIEELLDHAEVVRPQNVFTVWPWHARWDTGRTLLARAWGGDWPGTLGVRRKVLLDAGGYRGDVMFENLELVRTVRAVGGREHLALDLVVDRLPPTARHFWGQRVRQAYDELARPGRMALELALLPAALLGGRRVALTIVGGSVALAELGRRRAGGTRWYPFTSALLAPCWVAERAVTSWLAVATRVLRGGVRYGGGVLRDAASSERSLRARG
jgi:hypothetical protein